MLPGLILCHQAQAGEELIYTIQAASFKGPKDATRLYRWLEAKLPPANRQYLRLEQIDAFFVIRAGKSRDAKSLQATLALIKKMVPGSHIMRAYYREARIITGVKSQELPPAGKGGVAGISRGGHRNQQAVPMVIQATKVLPPLLPPNSKKFISNMLAKYLSSAETISVIHRQEARKKAAQITPSPGCLAAHCHAGIIKVKRPHLPVLGARCSVCHEVKKNIHHPSGGKNDFLPSGSIRKMCAKCHPAASMGKTIHAPFKEGKCLVCHLPHGSDNKFLLPTPDDDQKKLCLSCHKHDKITGFKNMHGPVDLGACTFCHSPHSSNQPNLLRKPGRELCLDCHQDIKKNLATMPNIHTPVKGQNCLICHLPHGSKSPNLLLKKGEKLCFSCHEDIRDKMKHSRSKHAALYLNKQCATCHRPHFSKFKNLLIKREEPLCLSCHRSGANIPGFRPFDIASQLKGQEYLHGPIRQGKCAGCHDPHGSDNKKLLTAPMVTSFYAPYNSEEYGLCFKCHDRKLLTARETTTSTRFRNGNRNLHYVHVAKEFKGRTCKTCHQTHASNGPMLISSTRGAKFGSWHISIAYTITKSGGSCTPSCHRKMTYDRDKAHDNSAKAVKYGKYYVDYKSNK